MSPPSVSADVCTSGPVRTASAASPPVIAIHRERIGDGDPGIRRTVEVMVQIIRAGARHPAVRFHAERAVALVPPGDPTAEIEAVRQYVVALTRYRRDPIETELLRTPWFVLAEIARGKVPQLDCDDLTILTLSLLGSIGFRTAVRVVSTRPSREYNHVFGLVLVRGQWMAFDLTRSWLPPGAPVPAVTRLFDTEV